MATPGSGTISIAQINGSLGRGNNLGAYRGQTFYRNGSPVTISNNPRMNEFYGLSPYGPLDVAAYNIVLAGSGWIQLAYRPRTGELWVPANNGIDINSWSAQTLVNPANYQPLNIGYQYLGGNDLQSFVVNQGLGQNPDDYFVTTSSLTDTTQYNVRLSGNGA